MSKPICQWFQTILKCSYSCFLETSDIIFAVVSRLHHLILLKQENSDIVSSHWLNVLLVLGKV